MDDDDEFQNRGKEERQQLPHTFRSLDPTTHRFMVLLLQLLLVDKQRLAQLIEAGLVSLLQLLQAAVQLLLDHAHFLRALPLHQAHRVPG